MNGNNENMEQLIERGRRLQSQAVYDAFAKLFSGIAALLTGRFAGREKRAHANRISHQALR